MISLLLDNRHHFPVNQEKIRLVILEVLKKNALSSAEISISIVKEGEMQELSKKYLGDQKQHAVLAFPLEDSSAKINFPTPDKVRRLGDIVISYPTALKAAKTKQKTADQEISFLIEHACCHLLGKHHD